MDSFILCEEDVVKATEIVAYGVAVVSVGCSLVLLYAVSYHSPREMGSYKWYIAVNGVCGAAWELAFALAHFEPAFPAPILMAGGLFKRTLLPDWMVYAGLNCCLVYAGGLICSVIAMFVYRYCHTSSDYVFFGLLRPSQFRAVALLLILLGFLAGLLAVNQTVMSSADVKKMLAGQNPELFEVVRDRTILGIKGLDEAATRWALIFFECCCVVYVSLIVFCTYGCYSTLQSNKHVLSTQTLRLYRILVNSLVIDLAFCLLLAIAPLLLAVTTFSARLSLASTATVIGATVASVYPLASHALWLFYIAPYRRVVLRLLRLEPRRRGTVVVFTQRSSSRA